MRRRGESILHLLFACVVLASCARVTTPPVDVRAVRIPTLQLRTVALEVRGDPKLGEALPESVLAEIRKRAEKALEGAGVPVRPSDADAKLLLTVQRYRARVGSDLGVETPSAVAFLLELVAENVLKTPVWQARYSAEDQALTDNLFNFWKFARGGARWLTAVDLMGIGLDEASSRLNDFLRGEEAPAGR